MGADGEPDVGPIRIVVADDHWIVREGLRRFLLSDPEFQVVGEAENGLEAVRLAKELRPDVVLMDLLMPELDGVVALEEVHRELPEVALLALTSAAENELVVGAMRAGATGYILKDGGGDELKRAIRAAAAGQVHLSPQVAAHLLRGIRMPHQPLALTDREQDVLRLLARGLANKEIARALGIGDGTVKTHVSSILAKLRVQGRTQAALAAIQLGLVTPDQLRQR